jgi:hypothetical protein
VSRVAVSYMAFSDGWWECLVKGLQLGLVEFRDCMEQRDAGGTVKRRKILWRIRGCISSSGEGFW